MNARSKCLQLILLFLLAILVIGAGDGGQTDKALAEQNSATTVVKMLGEETRLTSSPVNDEDASIIRARDGEKGSFLTNKTSETYYATSKDGIEWDEPVAVTNDTDHPYLDILPTAYETKDDCYIVWVTWHRVTPNDADAVEVPLSDARGERAAPFVKGVSVRVVPADEEKFIVFYVHDETEKETDKGDNHDVYYQFFERVPGVK